MTEKASLEDPIAASAKRRGRVAGGKRNGRLVGALAMALAGAAAPAAGDVPESLTIPLKVVQIPGVGAKVGIEVSLGGGAPRLYTFDTGSSGFYAAYNPAWWPSSNPVGGGPIYQSYGSDLQLIANPVSTTIGIATKEGVPISVTTVVGQITGASGTADGIAWLDNVAAGNAPLYGMFFGDFGSGLKALNGMFAVLPQLPGNLSSGFAVQLGCNGNGLEPKVVVGLTEAIRSRVTSWVKMEKEDPNSPPFPHSNLPTYGQSLFTGKFLLAREGASYGFSVPAILDTGGGTTDIHQHSPAVTVPDALLNAAKNRVLSRKSVQSDRTGHRARQRLRHGVSHRKHADHRPDQRLAFIGEERRGESGAQPVLQVRRGIRCRAGQGRLRLLHARRSDHADSHALRVGHGAARRGPGADRRARSRAVVAREIPHLTLLRMEGEARGSDRVQRPAAERA